MLGLRLVLKRFTTAGIASWQAPCERHAPSTEQQELIEVQRPQHLGLNLALARGHQSL